MEVPQDAYEAIENEIASDASPVGIDAKKTHMKAGLAVFEKFLDGIFIAQRKDKAVKARDADAKLDF